MHPPWRSLILASTAALLALVPAAPGWAQSQPPANDPARALYRNHACFACHGEYGRSLIEAYPDLAGQDVRYLINQVRDIVSGARKGSLDASGNPRAEVMRAALVAPDGEVRFKDVDLKIIAGWLAMQPPAQPLPQAKDVPKARIQAGEGVFRQYMCASCHGREGQKPMQGYPYLAAMKRNYVVGQLRDFRDKTRTNRMASVMASIVKRMTDQEIDLVADYIAQIERKPKEPAPPPQD
jgi:cytochrome c553